MVQLSMTLSDLWPRFQGHDIFRHWISEKKRAIVIDLDWPLNASSSLSASAELLVLLCNDMLMVGIVFPRLRPLPLRLFVRAAYCVHQRIGLTVFPTGCHKNNWTRLCRLSLFSLGAAEFTYDRAILISEYCIVCLSVRTNADKRVYFRPSFPSSSLNKRRHKIRRVKGRVKNTLYTQLAFIIAQIYFLPLHPLALCSFSFFPPSLIPSPLPFPSHHFPSFPHLPSPPPNA